MANGTGMEEVTTVFIGGFPQDALPRELDNLCRFFPGFVTSNMSTAKGTTLFVLFDSSENAHAAIKELNGQMFDRSAGGEPMRATMARSNMRSNSSSPAAVSSRPAGVWSPSQPPPPSYPPPPGHPGTGSAASKRPRIPEDPTQVDTVASVGALEAGIDEESLHAFFEQLPGFLEFRANPRMGGGFAKFTSAPLATQAVQTAKDEGVPAEMAKSSMSIGSSAGSSWIPSKPQIQVEVVHSSTTPDYSWQQEASSGVSSAKRPRIPEDPGSVDTVASVGALEAGFDESALKLFYQHLPGFVAFKSNPRMGGGFAKFSSSPLATSAVQKAHEQGIPAEIARSSMSVVSP